MKQKVKNQSTRVVDGGQDYHEYLNDEHNVKRGLNGERAEGNLESIQANPNNLPETAGYWAVDEATQNIQAKVRLMLEKAKQVLTQQQYNAFVLVDLKHLTLRDAAKVMEVNHARVDQLIKRARLKLQAVYNGLE